MEGRGDRAELISGSSYHAVVTVLHLQYSGCMKTATIPPVRIDPAFRREMEESLQGSETLAALVEVAVRNEIARRKTQAEFVRRGMVAIQETVAKGNGIPAEEVIAILEQKLATARQRKRHQA